MGLVIQNTCSSFLHIFSFPSHFYIVKHIPTNKYGCYCSNGTHGVACFTEEVDAMSFAAWIDVPDLITERTSFDEAREIAKTRPMPVTSLMLLDNLNKPEIHFVK